ncbi:MAG TPA: O-methyltransferase [Bacteroidales bacterium]|nr:O-methyltransferase [Bacteroidales bacterium]
MNPKLEHYLKNHSSSEDPVLEDLFRQTHIRFVNPNMASGHIQGKFLEFISRMIGPENILEIGTFTGYSAICLSKGLKPGGNLITIEINDELASFAHSYFVKAGVESKITQLTGDALEIIPGLTRQFELVFIDGDKREYVDYFRQIFEKVKPGGFIIADNTLWGNKVLENVTSDPQARGIIEFNEMIKNDNSVDKMILPLRDGLTIIYKPI